MATPLSADKLLKALRDEGLHVVEHRSWRTNNRNHKGPWGPTHGVMIHHTVTSGTASSVELCYNGHSALPGPLCHGVIAKDGTVHLVGNGRANHAGLGDDDVLRAVIAEKALPPDNEANTDGNRYFYGFECVNLGDGKDPWPAAQLLAIERAAAAVCRAHNWSQRSVIGHLEWQPGKVDPRGFTMNSMRTRIGKRLDGSPDGPSQPPPKPTYEPFPGSSFFAVGRNSPVVTAMGKRLVAEGCGRYTVGPGPAWSTADRNSYAAWQRKLGYTGTDADGIPGKSSWDRLKVPNV
ncbi:peptidoglycan-binding protein [Streptomyces microflavus]|uniref:N-acetylmuramoyl-L-alanine amidase n=1 Tax=Streptomyces microflavus TaxID=1919 RepID=A0A6N9VH08_STRMI|nr:MULTISPECIES: peptidoglycan-binding protein [Streptomyces]MBW3358490.1 peptidoglycan-binding protein [Streptomyces sp. 09ZI22]MEE1730152.1 peptidoglycan-binding protein [Streptomyces sp. BE282]NEB70762.1 N-acetylmuramoyl-L-alanine amidase [Streptomyces microflavus]OXY84656.1 N-acetylmuramoyl-L-alanine amidase [Streptomyces sp. 2R]QKW43056.1 N-acetylmuramoyl-L-alanine amidase [Streptomyces microflavus]